MRKIKKQYYVNTGNCSSFFETLDQAIDNYNMWIDFYVSNWGKYGTERTITLSHKNKTIYSMCLSE